MKAIHELFEADPDVAISCNGIQLTFDRQMDVWTIWRGAIATRYGSLAEAFEDFKKESLFGKPKKFTADVLRTKLALLAPVYPVDREAHGSSLRGLEKELFEAVSHGRCEDVMECCRLFHDYLSGAYDHQLNDPLPSGG